MPQMPASSGPTLPLCRHSADAMSLFTDSRQGIRSGNPDGELEAAPPGSSSLIPSASLSLKSFSLWSSASVPQDCQI